MVRSNAVRAVAVEQQRRGPVARRRAQLEEGNRHTDAIRGLGIGYQRVVATCFKTGARLLPQLLDARRCRVMGVQPRRCCSVANRRLACRHRYQRIGSTLRALPELEMGAAQVCAKLGSHLIRKLRVDRTMRIFRTKS